MAEPTKIKIPFASSGSKNTIPTTSQIGIVDGKASYPDGFVPLNFTPKTSGGIPPDGKDMNGVLYEMSNIIKFMNSGGVFVYDAAFQTDIGGYPIGAFLYKADGSGYWMNTTASNMTNPDTGGAGWQSIDPFRHVIAGGTTSAYTATFNPAIASLVDGMTITINTTSVGTNAISAPTLSVNGLTPAVIKKLNTKNVAIKLAIGDVPSRGIYQYVASGSYWLLLNPAMNGKLIAVRKYTTAGASTYTETDGTNYVRAVAQGAGAGGGGTQLCAANQRAGGGGGGSGSRAEGTFYENFSGVTITVGAKGTGVSGAAGNNGGTSSFGALLSASGGLGGPLGTAVAVTTNDGWILALGGGGGNVVSGGDVQILGGVGDKAITMTTGAISGRGAAAPFGTASATEVSSTSGALAGYNASRAGHGGGGAVCGQSGGAAQAGGNGGDGEVIVYEFG